MKDIIVVILVLFFIASCKQRYEVSLPFTQTAFLVVEGNIITNGVTTINLSRTTLLEERKILFEKGAEVKLESDNNTVYALIEKDSGRYELPFSNLDENVKYRISIKTRDNREYVSSYVEAIKTPVIDSITWARYNDGIEIYVNADDPGNNTQYYRFQYEEAWEFNTPYLQRMIAEVSTNPTPSVSLRWYHSNYTPRDSITNCWQFRSSSRILLGTTARLSGNKMYSPLVYYPKGSGEFAHLYSIKVIQYGISKEEYDFFQKMKKNTESLGTIFDVQPSELSGNFRSLTDTSEVIIGYVGATRLREKRTFIDNKDLVGWDHNNECVFLEIGAGQESLLQYFYHNANGFFIPIEPSERGIFISEAKCVDCTLNGTNEKPSFWP